MIVICAIAKLENNYVYYWAEYHLALGFDHVFIYDNNDINGEKIQDVFISTPIEDQVTIIDFRGIPKAQLKAYNDFYHSYEFDWCAFIDIDEFITFSRDSRFTKIGQLVSCIPDCNAIVINWLCYGDCGMVHYSDEPVTERFPDPIKPVRFIASLLDGTPENCHVKSIIRKGLDIDWEKQREPSPNPHIPYGLTTISTPSGTIVQNSPWQEIDHNVAFIRHYITMSIEEYERRVRRGASDTGSMTRYNIARFFRYNKPTWEKMRLAHKLTGRSQLIPVIKEIVKWNAIEKKSPIAKLFKSYRNYLNSRG